MSASYKSIRKRINVLNGFEEDACAWRIPIDFVGLELWRARNEDGEIAKGYILSRTACGGMIAWSLRLSALWKVDSVLRAIENGDEPESKDEWDTVEVTTNKPAEFMSGGCVT